MLDRSTQPPRAIQLQYLLDKPTTADLMQSFPGYLVSEELAEQLEGAGLAGFWFDDADVLPSYEYTAAYGDAPHKAYRLLRLEPDATTTDAWISEDLRLCVSDRMMAVLKRGDLYGCDIEPLA